MSWLDTLGGTKRQDRTGEGRGAERVAWWKGSTVLNPPEMFANLKCILAASHLLLRRQRQNKLFLPSIGKWALRQLASENLQRKSCSTTFSTTGTLLPVGNCLVEVFILLFPASVLSA